MKFQYLSMLAACAGLALLSSPLLAQEDKPEQQQEKDQTAEEQQQEGPVETPEIIQRIVDEDRASWLGEEDALGYDRGGRRDPFIPLIRDRGPRQQAAGEEAPVLTRPRPPGIAGMDIAEIDLVGVVVMANRTIAHFNGSDNFGYFLGVGGEVYDGKIVTIEDDRVVFEQRISSKEGDRTRQVVKKLRSK